MKSQNITYRRAHHADNNIIFIGMPAVGKSTVGVVIAKRLGYRFVDTDILIQESEGKLLKETMKKNMSAGYSGNGAVSAAVG